MKEIALTLLVVGLSLAIPVLAQDPEGFKILEVKKGGIYEKLGLKNNDILLKINGEALKDIKQIRTVFDSLKKGEFIKIELFRKGKIENISYDIR